MGKPSAPATPDYKGAAVEQGQANLVAARLTNRLNRPNEYSPDGSRVWTDDGKDNYSVTTTYSPAQQALYDAQNRISRNYVNTAEAGLGRVGDALSTKFNSDKFSPLKQTLNTGDNAALTNDFSGDKANVQAALDKRTNADYGHRENDLQAQLANQGLAPGSAAYNRAYEQLNQGRNDALSQNTLAAGQEQNRLQQLALATNQQQFGQDQTAAQFSNQSRTQGISEEAYLRQIPINETNALRTGSQVSAPQFQQYYTGATVNAAPIYQATKDTGDAEFRAYQEKAKQSAAITGAVAGIASSAFLSDPRMKTDVLKIDRTPGGHNVYRWNWKDGSGEGYGVMADEVAKKQPDALGIDRRSGMLMVDYSKVH